MWKQSSSRRVVHASSLSAGGGGIGVGNSPSTSMNMNMNAPSSPVSPRSKFFSSKTILSSRNLIPPGIPFMNKGMLSTSPGTGGALVGMMGAKDNTVVSSSSSPTSGGTSSSFSLPQSGVFNYDLFARMLSAAEDVGRRAVNVAHVGDTRAYLAMKFMIANENLSSMHSSDGITPMEGMEEEEEDEYGIGDNDLNTPKRRGRAISADQDQDEDDEMPFALAADEDEEDESHLEKPFMTQNKDKERMPSTVISSMNSSKAPTRTSNQTIQIHFREALSCYMKSLTMLKGSVNASQRILKELNEICTSASGSTEAESIRQFQKRCEVSHAWLAGQFKGVLDRAEAGNTEVSKLANNDLNQSDDHNNGSPATPMTDVNELIYNHSLACGRDGAVKQLLGQNEAARACYRSAGLLAETLLMEQKLVDDDKKILEGYVQGFAERINELDYIMLHQSRQSMVGSGSVRRGSSVVPLPAIAGFTPPQQNFVKP
jgi:hypothetical protein